MMPKRGDDRLIAYLDGEVETTERREIEAWLDADPTARERLAALAESANLVRLAFDEVLREPVPERLIVAARGEKTSREPSGKIVLFKARQGAGQAAASRRWWTGLPVAASLFGLLAGGSVAYFSVIKFAPGDLVGKPPALASSLK